MQMGVYLFLLLFLFMFSGIPIALSICLCVLTTVMIWGDIPMLLIFQQFYQGVDSFTLLAIPMFILAGSLMMDIGLIDDIVALCKILVGRLRGAMAHINIVASVFFASMSGSAVADTASIGAIMIPAMEKEGYDKDFSVAVTAASSIIGPIIPPSIAMVVYASIMPVSAGAMFMGGIAPGVLMAIGLMIVAAIISKKRNYPKETKIYKASEAAKIILHTLPALITPIIILGSIFGGICSATEAAAVANLYVIIVGIFYYKSLTLKKFIKTLATSMITAGAVLMINAAAKPLSYMVAYAQLPTMMVDAILKITSSKYVVLLLMNVCLLFLGCFMECNANILIFAPIFWPVAKAFGIDPLHFGVMFCVNVVVGICTPPFGPCLFLGASIAKRPVESCMKAIMPFVLIEIGVIILITYVPDVVLFLPRLTGQYMG